MEEETSNLDLAQVKTVLETALLSSAEPLSLAELKKLFEEGGGGKAKRDRRITEAVYNHGYSQVEVARHLKLHYSTVSRLIKSATKEQK